MMGELNVLIPSPVPVKLSDGQAVEVWPLRARQFAPFAAAAEPLMDEYEYFLQAGDAAGGPAYWRALVQRRADDVIAALAVALELPAERIGDLFLDDLLALAAKVIEVNLDFLSQRVTPMAAQAMGGLAALGRTSSTNSSAPDTATRQDIP